MEILNLGSSAEDNVPAPKARKKLRVILGIGALAAVTGIGSTLAANISLNGGGNVEFGQGVATTAACDGNVTLTPVSTFSNSYYGYGESTFAMTAIQISNIDLTPEGWDDESGEWNTNFDRSTRQWSAGNEDRSGTYINADGNETPTCEGKVLMLRAYTDQAEFDDNTVDSSISSPLYLNDGYNEGVGFKIVYKAASGTGVDGLYDADLTTDFDVYRYVVTSNGNSSAVSVEYDVFDYAGSSLTIDLNSELNPPADSRWIDKITIESADTLPSNWTENTGG